MFTYHTEGLQEFNYWERLQKMTLQSVQRRHERYRLIYIWKVVNGLVPNCGLNWASSRYGTKIIIPKSKDNHSAIARAMREQSLANHGGKIFNLLPDYLRDWRGSSDCFKEKLDGYLQKIPDQPFTGTLIPEPINRITCRHSNSLYEWILHLNLNCRYTPHNDDISIPINESLNVCTQVS